MTEVPHSVNLESIVFDMPLWTVMELSAYFNAEATMEDSYAVTPHRDRVPLSFEAYR